MIISELTKQLEARLPELAHEIIAARLDDSGEQQRFLEHPDDPRQHEPRWHQFGIITHNRRAAAAYEKDVPCYVADWGVGDRLADHLSRLIDGVPCAELLSAGLLFHDIGKFAARTSVEKEGIPGFSFQGHGRFSGEIVRGPLFDPLAKEYGISPSQREYIALCGERHYDLGVLRAVAKTSLGGYTIAFTEGDDFRDAVRGIIATQPGLAPEIGLLFFADNLSKTDIRLPGVATDADIEPKSLHIPGLLRERGLNPLLLATVQELPVTIAVARKYLDIWAKT